MKNWENWTLFWQWKRVLLKRCEMLNALRIIAIALCSLYFRNWSMRAKNGIVRRKLYLNRSLSTLDVVLDNKRWFQRHYIITISLKGLLLRIFDSPFASILKQNWSYQNIKSPPSYFYYKNHKFIFDIENRDIADVSEWKNNLFFSEAELNICPFLGQVLSIFFWSKDEKS